VNIFVLDKDPKKSAEYMCNKHIVKMILESVQLLSTTDRMNGLGGERYKITYKNHPCVRCLENRNNYEWLKIHLKWLLKEYRLRYGKVHKCEGLYNKYWKTEEETVINFKETSFPKCMLEEYKTGGNDIDEIVESYRRYYRYKKKVLSKFEYYVREEPEWLK